MSNAHLSDSGINAEIVRYFDDSSFPNNAPPSIVFLMGGVAAGKTTLRKQRFATGYVLVDAAEIFINLSRGEFLPFPGLLGTQMETIGRMVAKRAIAERRHIVTELIGSDFKPTQTLIQAMTDIGYKTNLQGVTCDVEVALQRNAARGDESISAYYAEPYQRRWLSDAAVAVLKIRNTRP